MIKMFTKIVPALAMALLLCCPGAFAQNETCSGAQLISCGETVTGSTTGVANDNATSGATSCDILPLGSGGQRWFIYMPENNETAVFSLCDGGTNYDSRIDVYTGACGSLICVGSNDDECGSQSEFTFDAVCGTTYYVRVGGYSSFTGDFSLTLSCLPSEEVSGCTDPAACNYLPCAISDDGSCCYSGCIAFNMADEFGDGWNGATASFYSFDTEELIATFTLADGATGTEFLCLDPGCYYVDVTNGSYPDEISWTLVGVDGETVSGGAPEAGVVFSFGGAMCIPGCTDVFALNFDPAATVDDGSCVYCGPGEQLLIFNMVDSYGDGWTGAGFIITDVGGSIVAQGNLDNAQEGDGLSYGFDSFCLEPGCYSLTVTAGSFPGDIGWSITDLQGNVILNAPAGSGAPVSNIGFAWGGQEGCEIPGCTDPGCLNYNPSATEDDGSCECPPDNDQCANAEAIGCGMSVNGTTINSTFDNGLTSCQGLAVSSPGVWYTFIGTGDQVTLSTCPSSPNGTVTDTRLHAWSGSCGNFTCVAANDDDPNCTYYKSSITFTAANGVSYFILVSEYSTGIGLDFILEMSCVSCEGSSLVNDDCAGALTQPDNIPTPGSLCCANPDDISDCYSFSSGYGVWFTMNSGSFDSFDFMLTNGDLAGVDANDGTNVGMVVYTSGGDCGSLEAIACCPTVADVCGGSLYEAGIDVTPNTQYYFLVYTTDPANCGTFTLNTNLINVGCTDPSATNYDPTADIDDGSCEYPGPPVNDLCEAAIALSCNSTVTGTTGLATNTGAPDICPGVASDAGVWYTFVGDGQLTTISTCGSQIDSRIAIVSTANGCAGPYTCVDSEDNDSGLCGFFDADDASIEFVSTSGTTYYVYISAGQVDINGDGVYDLFDGSFTLSFDCAPVVNGCMDECACNYDPSANIEDNSCEYFSCVNCPGGTSVMLTMLDAFGDGWNNATYTVDDLEGNIIFTGDLDGAQCTVDEDNSPGPESGFDMLCFQDGCYTITAGGGDWDGEVSFDILDENGLSIASGGANEEIAFTIGSGVCGCTDSGACNYDPTATDDDGSCEYVSCAGCTDPTACNFDPNATIAAPVQCCYNQCLTFQMSDGFGDGWNGNVAVLTDAGTGAIVGTATLASGSAGSTIFCVQDGCYVLTVGGGSFPGEIGWVLVGANGGLMTGGANTPSGIQFSVGSSNCNPGCLEPLACNYDPSAGISDCTLCEYVSCQGCTYLQSSNYNPAATIDDGSCIIDSSIDTCPADINEDGLVGVADLIIFIGAFGSVCN
ncbi:MAG: hypothetical protein IT223_08320 [Crocinitomicaceae bacterium]|nr:hypothetical protein [Crocinitomicaceae bacterium]